MLRISRHNFYLPSWKRAERDIISGIREGRIFVKAFILNLSYVVQFSSVAQLCLTLRFHGHCPSSTPRAYSNSCPLHRWCHPTISSSIVPLSSCLQPFPALGSFPISQFFAFGGQSILGLCQILSKPAFTCHFCPTLPRTLMLPPVTVTRGKVVVVYGLSGDIIQRKAPVLGKSPSLEN